MYFKEKPYHCFSHKQKFYLENLGFKYAATFIHYKTKKRVWVFHRAKGMDKALQKWKANNQKIKKI